MELQPVYEDVLEIAILTSGNCKQFPEQDLSVYDQLPILVVCRAFFMSANVNKHSLLHWIPKAFRGLLSESLLNESVSNGLPHL